MTDYLFNFGFRCASESGPLVSQIDVYWILFPQVTTTIGVPNYLKNIWVKFLRSDMQQDPLIVNGNYQFLFNNTAYIAYPPNIGGITVQRGSIVIAIAPNSSYIPDKNNLYMLVVPASNVGGNLQGAVQSMVTLGQPVNH